MRLVFVSSTFKDMQFERDALSSRVAPRIDTFLSLYGENVHFGDLRWGVNTSEMDDLESSKKVLKVCLDEIDDCRPYMIVFIGERYGWIPSSELLQEVERSKGIDVIEEDISVTNLEIEYGALLNPDFEGRILFYFRNLDLSEMSEAERKIYEAESPIHKEKLDTLKQKILKMYPEYVRYYDAKYDKSSGNIVNLEPVMDMVYNDLTRIFKIDLDKYNAMPNYVRAMMNSHTRMEKFFKNTYRREDLDYSLGVWKTTKNYTHAKYDDMPLMHCVCGDIGTGRKTFLASLYEESLKLDTVKIPFIVGMDEFTKGKEEFISVLVNTFEDELKVPHSEDYSIQHLAKLCKDVASINKTFQIFVMSATKAIYSVIRGIEAYTTGELKGCDIKNISFYVSDEEDVASSSPLPFYLHSKITYLQDIEEKEERIKLVHAILKSKHKELPKEVINLITSKESGGNPLYLSLIIERLLILDHEDFQNIRNMGDGMVAISKYMSLVVSQSGDNIKDISKELLKELVERINPTLVPLFIRMVSYNNYHLDYKDMVRFFNKMDYPFNEIDYSLFVHSIPSLFQDSSLSSSLITFKCDDIFEGANELLDELGTANYYQAMVDFVKNDESKTDIYKDMSLFIAYYAFDMVDECAKHFLHVINKMDLVNGSGYNEKILEYLFSLYKFAFEEDSEFFYKVIKKLVDIISEEQYEDYPRLASYIYLPFLYHLDDASLYKKWGEYVVDVIHYVYKKHKVNKSNPGLTLLLGIGDNILLPILDSFRWFNHPIDDSLPIFAKYDECVSVNTQKFFEKFQKTYNELSKQGKLNPRELQDFYDFRLYNQFRNAFVYDEIEDFCEYRCDLIIDLYDSVVREDGPIKDALTKGRQLTIDELMEDNGVSLITLMMKVVDSINDEDNEMAVFYYHQFSVVLEQYLKTGVFFAVSSGHLNQIFETAASFISVYVDLPDDFRLDFVKNLTLMIEACKYFLIDKPYNYGVITSALMLIGSGTYFNIQTKNTFSYIYSLSYKAVTSNYGEIMFNHHILDMVRHKRSLFNGENDIDDRMVRLVIDIYLSDKLNSDDLYLYTMIFGVKYLRDDQREDNHDDPFLKKYYEGFVSLVFDIDYEHFLNDFFETEKLIQ